MDELRIVGRIYPMGTDFLAVVSAVPVGARPERTNEHMTKVCSTYLEASDALKRMCVAVGRQVLERGHQITAVDIEERSSSKH